VPAVLRRLAVGRGAFRGPDAVVETLQRLTTAAADVVTEFAFPSRQRPNPLLEGPTFAVQRGFPVVAAFGAVHRGEHRLEGVVVLLRDGIELVVVALGAMDGLAGEGPDDVGHHVIAVEVPGDLPVGLRLRQFLVPDEIPGSCGEKPERLDSVGGVGIKHVAGDLLGDEPAVGLVLVEGPDDVVAIGPGVGTRLVLVVTVGVAVVDDVQPGSGPPFPVVRRGQQAVDPGLVGPGIRVRDEGIHLFRTRGQPGEVQGHPADQGPTVGLRCGLEPGCREAGADEGVDRVGAWGIGSGADGRWGGRPHGRAGEGGSLQWLQRPPVPRIGDRPAGVVGPGGALLDPGPDQPERGGIERVALRRHAFTRLQSGDQPEQVAGGGIAGDEARAPGAAIPEARLLHIDAEVALLFVGSVAFETAGGQDGADVGLEVDAAVGGGREVGRSGTRRCRQCGEQRLDGDQQQGAEPRERSPGIHHRMV
jgi:hypothetical protein